MLNREPVFINALSRSGSNILFNLLHSHPDLCVPAGETHLACKGGARIDSRAAVWRKKLLYRAPLALTTERDAFSRTNLEPRRGGFLGRAVMDKALWLEKVLATHPWHNLHQAEGVKYRFGERVRSRLLSKNIDGIIFLSDELRTMYPDATFFCLVRHGLAVCEGHLRRGDTARETGILYRKACSYMLDLVERCERAHLVRFEHIVEDPIGVMRRLYEAAGLDASVVSRIRFQNKAVMNPGGERARPRPGADRDVIWYPLDDTDPYFERSVDQNQIDRLDAADKKAFLDEAGDVMAALGYS